MKRKIWITLLVIVSLAAIAAVVLLATRCDHNWLPATCTEPITCSICGKTEGSAMGHVWQDATCTSPKTCTACGLTEGDALGHTWQDATCTDPQTCTVCGEKGADANGHDWQEATCAQPETCATCGATQGVRREHDYLAATCQAPETCRFCGLTQGSVGDHAWQEVTCTTPKTCTTCGLTEGEALGHQWVDANCQAPKTCTTCGLTEGEKTPDHQWNKANCSDPRTCTTCGKTEGSALGHNWIPATCTAPKTCTKCGMSSGTALGHDLEPASDGESKICKTCGETVKTKCVALTFDDGPSGNITKKLLEGLAQRNAKVTFFLCGYRIESYRSYPQLILDYGHEIGLHTDNHATLTKLDKAGIRKELQDVIDMLPSGYHVRLMRPPGGAYNSKVKEVCLDMGLSVIMWSVDPRDWETNNVQTIVDRVVNNARNGSIILMHDLKSSSVEAALQAIDILQSMGFEFVTVSELAAIQGRPLEAGKVYSSLS